MPQYRFSIPSLPRTLWKKFQEIRKLHGLTQRETLIVALVSWMRYGCEHPEEVEKIVRETKDGKYDSEGRE